MDRRMEDRGAGKNLIIHPSKQKVMIIYKMYTL